LSTVARREKSAKTTARREKDRAVEIYAAIFGGEAVGNFPLYLKTAKIGMEHVGEGGGEFGLARSLYSGGREKERRYCHQTHAIVLRISMGGTGKHFWKGEKGFYDLLMEQFPYPSLHRDGQREKRKKKGKEKDQGATRHRFLNSLERDWSVVKRKEKKVYRIWTAC